MLGIGVGVLFCVRVILLNSSDEISAELLFDGE